ncbi:MAG: DUF421 domain-containing protein [Desulfitobacteriaceae bacterium]|nr:DUF421 domain-containing protein [Desulfitobacteriaceae bacterium]MDD4751631.1 DUF421 domain-containing protein [Desulfitobacteriaceae bacterium]
MPEWLTVFLRGAGLWLFILAAVRVMGKKHPSRMRPFDFVNYTVVGVVAALTASRVMALVPGVILLGVWILSPIILDLLMMKSKWVHDFVSGKETVLIRQGKIMEENLAQVRLTGEDLLRELRSKSVFKTADVEFAVLEPTGEINILLKSDQKPVTAQDLGQKTAPRNEPQTVILDGNIIDEALSNLGLNREWLGTKLEAAGVSLNNVFIGQVDAVGDLFLDLFDDSLEVPAPKIKELIYANLEKCHADLMGFSLQTKNQQAKDIFNKDAKKLLEVKEQLKPYLLK